MMPHEQLLVKRLQAEPFVLLGINIDTDASQPKALDARLGNNWRSWWDPEQKIAERWNVEMLPTIYIIDHRGQIRFAQPGFVEDDVLERVIDNLVREAKQAAG